MGGALNSIGGALNSIEGGSVPKSQLAGATLGEGGLPLPSSLIKIIEKI